MNSRTTIAALVAASALALTACSSSSDSTTKSAPSPKVTTSKAAKPAGLTAKQAAAKLADATGVTTLGNPTDNTSACSNKAAGKEPNANDCSQLITTDTVSIYEYKSPAVAAHWVKGMKSTGDWRQVGRFALAWTARDQKLTDDSRRAELVKALEKATANES
ncbi:hypothetical protein JK361_25980 [Streptomyces sp. 5-8]|uniref:Lipoprotein n=1 Tax=Streptomyces musisoli TaxID=2802280 RepID=A0ABS1P7V4_9ACTN|nr:hypothetical protein [Streptomyces musisoli]MBL1107996.1 hypothetical protein [Streptomyces musisoli]